MYCSSCGVRTEGVQSFCRSCGLSLEAQTRILGDPPTARVSQTAAGGRARFIRMLLGWLVALASNIPALFLVQRLANTDSAIVRLSGEVNISVYTIPYIIGTVVLFFWVSRLTGRRFKSGAGYRD